MGDFAHSDAIDMVPKKKNWLAIWLAAALVLSLLVLLVVHRQLLNKNLAAESATKELAKNQETFSVLQKENEGLKKQIGEAKEKPPVPSGMMLVSEEQVKIWEGCCAREVQQKTQAAAKAVPSKKKPVKKAVKPIPKTIPAAAFSLPKPVPEKIDPSQLVLTPPQGECFELSLPQGN